MLCSEMILKCEGPVYATNVWLMESVTVKRTRTLLFVWRAALALGQPYDLLLKGGHVIDLANNVDGIRDVAIAGGKIARVAAGIPASEARRTVDVQRFYVTPGLIDLH